MHHASFHNGDHKVPLKNGSVTLRTAPSGACHISLDVSSHRIALIEVLLQAAGAPELRLLASCVRHTLADTAKGTEDESAHLPFYK